MVKLPAEQLHAEGYFKQHMQRRLAFREFGTTIGVQVNRVAGRYRQ